MGFLGDDSGDHWQAAGLFPQGGLM